MVIPLQSRPLREVHARYAPAEALLKKPGPNPKALSLDGEVLSQALYKGEAGVREVEVHHRSLFASSEGEDLPALLEYEATARGEHEALARAQDADAALRAKTNSTVPAKDEEEGAAIPWDGWDLAQALFYFTLAAALIVVGLRGVGMALQLSGLEVFDEQQTINRLLYSFVLVGLAAVLKMTWSHARTDSGRRNTAWVISIAGIGAAVCWAWLFSEAFGGGFSTELPDVVLGGPTSDAGGGGAHGGKLLTLLGIIAEGFISAACWIQGSVLMEKHRPIREAPNPKAVAIDERMDGRKPELGYLADLAARLRARIEAINHASAVFATSAVAKLKNAVRKSQRYLQASEDLEALSRAPAAAAGTNGRAVASNAEAALEHRERLLVAASRNGSAGAAEDDHQAQAPEDGDTGTTDNPDSEETSE